MLSVQAEWGLIHQAADKAVPKLQAGLIGAFDLIKVPDEVRHEGDISLVDFTGELRRVLRSQLAIVYAQGGAVALEHLPEPSRRLSRPVAASEYIFAFDIRNPRVSAWLDQYSAQKVTEISESVRRSIQVAMTQAYDYGFPPKQVARSLRSVVGLTVQQQAYIARFQANLEEQGYKPEHIAAKVEQYHKNWLKYRAETIARTETIDGAVAGQQEGWEQAVDAGRLSKEEYEQSWIITPDDRLCPRCRPMRGERAPIGGVFPGNLSGPTLHPR